METEARKLYVKAIRFVGLDEEAELSVISAALQTAEDRGRKEAEAETKCHDPALCPECAGLVERGRQEAISK